ncbi:MAG: hypothetical protein ACTHJW_27810 [Streptosporangiaceae bacterium]
MIVSAALCPAAPLLISDLTGAKQVAMDLRDACLASVAEMMASTPDIVAVVGADNRTGLWNGAAKLDLARYAPGPVLANGRRPADTRPPADPPEPVASAGLSPGLPSALGVGAWLLARAGSSARQVLQAVGADEPTGRCVAIGTDLAGSRERVGLLVIADGSARRGLKAPGHLDERSADFDAEIENAVREGRLDDLLAVDPVLARELMAAGRPAWQVLAGALQGRRVSSEIRYLDDPFGVAYLVASLRVHAET